MTFDLSTIRKNQQLPSRLVIYGVPGIGKTTLASRFPSPIFLPVEDGLGQLDAAAFPRPQSYDDVVQAISTLITEKHDYRTLRWRWAALLLNALVVPATVPLLFALGSEFMPPLYEGSLLYMPTAPPGMSITEGARVMQVQDKVIRRFPEVETVFGTIGRATTATDNSPMGMVNTTIVLKPREQWRPGMTVEKLQAEMDDALQFAGFPNTWTQPIRNRLDMLFTGIKTPVGIKILGPDLAVIQQLGSRIEVGAIELALLFWLVPQTGYLVASGLFSAYLAVSVLWMVWRGLNLIKQEEAE